MSSAPFEAKAIVFTGIGEVSVVPVTVPRPGPGEVALESMFTCISPGTELRCLSGKQPSPADWPYIPGYANVGRVIEVGAGCTIPIGSIVHAGGTRHASIATMWGAHVSHVVTNEIDLIPIPDSIDPLEASFTRLAAIAHRGVKASRLVAGESVSILGLGPIGQASARVHHAYGARVVALDIIQDRLTVAAAGGVITEESRPTASEGVRRHFPEGTNIVVDASGSAFVLRQAIECVRDLPWTDDPGLGGRLVLQGSHPADISFDYHAAFFKELAMIFPRDCNRHDMRAVLQLMSEEKLVLRDLISHVAAPDDARDVYARLQSDQSWITAAFAW